MIFKYTFVCAFVRRLKWYFCYALEISWLLVRLTLIIVYGINEVQRDILVGYFLYDQMSLYFMLKSLQLLSSLILISITFDTFCVISCLQGTNVLCDCLVVTYLQWCINIRLFMQSSVTWSDILVMCWKLVDCLFD